MAISSVRTKSTGFADMQKPKYSNTENNNNDSNSHPNAATQNPATMGKDDGREYMERPTTGIEKMGVGNQPCNDAACERTDTKHPSAADLADAGSMGGGARAMR